MTKNADAHSFINELPEGYDSIVGDKGIRLSGTKILKDEGY